MSLNDYVEKGHEMSRFALFYWMLASKSNAARNLTYEPAHDKTYKMACAPSEDSDQTDQSFLHMDSEDSDQIAKADLCLRWAHMPFCFVMRWLMCVRMLDKRSYKIKWGYPTSWLEIGV